MCIAMIVFVTHAVDLVLAEKLPYSLKAEKCSIGFIIERRIRFSEDSCLLLLLESQNRASENTRIIAAIVQELKELNTCVSDPESHGR